MPHILATMRKRLEIRNQLRCADMLGVGIVIEDQYFNEAKQIATELGLAHVSIKSESIRHYERLDRNPHDS
ncbi:hypothetical protein [Primorskyibacter sp. S87]|uniref:hypothetical protein n=1 Tax=Primorskyibacter sp. S87 TaxID=3415126 RepID=UPI003C7CA4A7